MLNTLKILFGLTAGDRPKPPAQNFGEASRPKRVVAIDCETTGLSAEGADRIVTLALVEANREAMPARALYLIFNPACRSHWRAEKVHGFDAWTLKHQDSFAQHAQEIAKFVSGALLVGHNIAFDLRFLRKEMAAAGVTMPSFDEACTMRMMEARHGRRISLDEALRLHTGDAATDLRGERHSALDDACIALGVYFTLTKGHAKIGVVDLAPENWREPPALPVYEDQSRAAKAARAKLVTPQMAKDALEYYQSKTIAATALGISRSALIAKLSEVAPF